MNEAKFHSRDPLHGVTLEMILTRLVEQVGWEAMGRVIKIKCFTSGPSIKSSLVFLRRNPWARERVERLYLQRCRVRRVEFGDTPRPQAPDVPKSDGDPKTE